MTPEPYFESSDVTIWNADARDAWRWLPENAVDAIVTSPPYWGLRDYGVDGQLGLEDAPGSYVADLADLLTGYARVLKDGGSLWLNLGDTYATGGGPVGSVSADSTLGGGHPHGQGGFVRGASDFPAKCLSFIPERVAMALIDRDWIVRSKVVWHKPNAMPESVKDRLSNRWEVVYHLVRAQRYHFDLDAIREPLETSPGSFSTTHKMRQGQSSVRDKPAYGPNSMATKGWRPADSPDGKNPGDVWAIATQGYPEAHFAVFPEELIRRPILATVPEGGVVLDPFFGSGTTAVMARRLGRKAWGIELNADYCQLAADRFTQEVLPLEAS